MNDQVLVKDEIRLSVKVKLEINFVSGVYFSTIVLFCFYFEEDRTIGGRERLPKTSPDHLLNGFHHQ